MGRSLTAFRARRADHRLSAAPDGRGKELADLLDVQSVDHDHAPQERGCVAAGAPSLRVPLFLGRTCPAGTTRSLKSRVLGMAAPVGDACSTAQPSLFDGGMFRSLQCHRLISSTTRHEGGRELGVGTHLILMAQRRWGCGKLRFGCVTFSLTFVDKRLQRARPY